MASANTEVDLDVSGPTARGVAATILSIVDEAGDDIDTAAVEVTAGDTAVTISGDGPRADEIVPQMVASIDWESAGLDGISVSLESTQDTTEADEPFEPPEDPDDGDRISQWESADVSPSKPDTDTGYWSLLLWLDQIEGSATSREAAEAVERSMDSVSGALSNLYNEHGLVERARVHSSQGGLNYTYRVNEHGRHFLDHSD